MKKLIFATLAMTVILFLWSGISQMFPWGVPSTQVVSTQSVPSAAFQVENVLELEAGTLTTDRFDEVFVNKISTLSTDKTFSWIISQPIDQYDAMRYFLFEIITQFLVALILATLLSLTTGLSFGKRIQLVLLGGVLAVAAIYGQQMNWWGVPAVYALGSGFNLIVGWNIAAVVTAKWILK